MPLSSRRLQREGGEMSAVGLAEPQHPIDRAVGLQNPQACSKLLHWSGTIHPRDNLQPVLRAFSIRKGCHVFGGTVLVGVGGSPPPPQHPGSGGACCLPCALHAEPAGALHHNWIPLRRLFLYLHF